MVDAGVTEHFFETDFSNHIGLFGLYGLGMHDQDGNSADVRKGTAEPGPGGRPKGLPPVERHGRQRSAWRLLHVRDLHQRRNRTAELGPEGVFLRQAGPRRVQV